MKDEPNSKVPSWLNQSSFMVHSWLAGSFHGSFKNGPRHLFTHPKNDRRATISLSNGIFNHLREQELFTRQLDLAIEVLYLFVGFYPLIFSLTFCSSTCALGSRNFESRVFAPFHQNLIDKSINQSASKTVFQENQLDKNEYLLRKLLKSSDMVIFCVFEREFGNF